MHELSLVASAVLASVISILSLLLYRRYLHALADFPGPWLASMTYLYEWYYDLWLPGQFTWKLKELHQRYGPVIRVNPDELHFNDPEFFDQIYNNSNGMTEKPSKAANAFGPYAAAVSTADHNLHRIRRGAINPFFSRRAVANLISFSKPAVEKLCSQFETAAKNGEVINLKYIYNAVTLDVITEYCFSESEDRLSKPDFDRKALDDIEGFIAVSLWNIHIPWLFTPFFNLPDWLLCKLNPAISGIFDTRERISQQVEDIRSGRNKQHELSGHNTILHSLLQSDLPDHEKGRERLRDEAHSIVSAGSGTVAHVLKATTYHVTKNPSIHRKLLEALKTVMPERTDTPALGQLEQLPYLTAVIMEGLRLSHAISHRLRRSFPQKALNYHGMVVPPNTTVMMTPMLIHENEDIFPQSKVFKPERWLEGDQRQLQRYLVPFARGTRGCAGSNLAWAELYIILGTVFRRFEFDISRVVQERDIDVSRDTLLGATARDSPGVLVGLRIAS